MGSHLNLLAVPSKGEKIWALLTNGKTLDRKPVKVAVLAVEQTFYGSEYTLTVVCKKGKSYSVTTAITFPKKPKQVQIQDSYGTVTVWR